MDSAEIFIVFTIFTLEPSTFLPVAVLIVNLFKRYRECHYWSQRPRQIWISD